MIAEKIVLNNDKIRLRDSFFFFLFFNSLIVSPYYFHYFSSERINKCFIRIKVHIMNEGNTDDNNNINNVEFLK